MAKKRFTDIEIWDKEWFMKLTPKMKCLMKYLHDKCDASGCWKPNWTLASVHINEQVNESDLGNLPDDQYEMLPGGKIFIPDFINFQYGKLSKASPAHNPIFIAIDKNNLSNRVFNRVPDTLQEKDKEEDKDKEEEIIPQVEIFEKKYICPEMQKVFKEYNPTYLPDQSRDYEPLLSIATFIHKQEKLIGNVTENTDHIIKIWVNICEWIEKDTFYSQKTLRTISNCIQEILNKAKNGSKKNGGTLKSKPHQASGQGGV